MGVEHIVGEAATKLASKTFGGVSKESAMEAIKAAAEKVAKAGEEAVAKVTQELQAYKGKSAQEMAELTSQKDAVILQTKNEAQAAVEAAQKQAAEQVKAAKAAARAPKVFEKTLPNGGKEIRKVSANGATMVKEYNANGQLLKVSVTQLDGSIRRTTYNPVTGKPVRTYTNIGGERLIEYKDGANSVTKAVNKKKARAEKPTLVSQSEPKRIGESEWGRESGIEIKRTYSDGSEEVIQKFAGGNNNRVVAKKVDADGRLMEKTIVWESGAKRIERFDRNGVREKTEEYLAGNGVRVRDCSKVAYLPEAGGRIEIGGEYSVGKAKITGTRLKDEFGFYTDKYKIKITYPKETGKEPVVIKEGTIQDIQAQKTALYNEFAK